MQDSGDSAAFIRLAISELCGLIDSARVRILDFGCGRGSLVKNLISLGYEVLGCDIKECWSDSKLENSGVYRQIEKYPYRLPFPDNYFDIVISTSVLEHAQNTEEVFREIKRVLKLEGVAMHLFGAKWYLPAEPHIYVLLVNYFWPYCPRWWFKLWAILGIRNEYQRGLPWRTTAELNYQYSIDGLAYYSNGYYRNLSTEIFGNFQNPMIFYIRHSGGGISKIAEYLPYLKFWGWISSNFRMNYILMRKIDRNYGQL